MSRLGSRSQEEQHSIHPHSVKVAEQRNLAAAMALTSSIMAVEVVGGILSNSLALLSDAWHMFADLTALVLCYMAGRVSMRPATWDKTYGYYRVEVLAALLNGATLVAVALFIFYEAVERLTSTPTVHGGHMLLVASIGLTANLASMTIISRRMLSLNVKAAFLHVLSDALSSMGVIAAAITIYLTGWSIIDPIIGIVIGAVIIYGASRMLGTVVNILLEGTPKHIDPKRLIERLRGIEGILDVHDLHVWSITSYVHVLSAHIVLSEKAMGNRDTLLNDIKRILKDEYGISHSTLQMEGEGYREIGEICSI
ncbi:MAG: cation diffusion facilitator family transporter [Candidatus Bathyarchaeia archaeon]